MLESRCVEDDVRLDFGDQRIDESGVPQVAEHQIIAGEQRRPLESELSGMEPDSSRSVMTSRAGSKRATCRQSWDPMDLRRR